MCDCFHLAFPNWHAASSGTGVKQTAAEGPGRRLRAPEPGTDDSTCDEPSEFTERPRPQGSSPVEEYPETEKYTDSDKECEAEHDPHHKSGSGKKTKKSGLGSMFEKRSTSKMSKLKEVHSPESGVIVKTAKDGCAEGLVYGGGGKDGIFIKEVVPESPASKSLKLKEGDQILSATVYFDNVSYEDAIQILEHAQAYKVKLCLKRKPDITETEPTVDSDAIPEDDVYAPEMREQGKTKRRGDARISWPKFPSFGKGRKSRFTRSHSSSEADEQRKLELSPTTSDTESPIKSQDALKGKKKHKIKLSVLTKRGRVSSSEDQDTDAQMLSPECLESPSGETPQVYVTGDLKGVEDLRCQQTSQELAEGQTVHHKVELITLDSTLKTEDLTVALAGQGSPSGVKSPDGKKKRSELKMKILGKDKSHKKDAKAKSPKRLKTLGASIEVADPHGNEKSDVIPSFESKLQGDQLALDANTKLISSSGVISDKSVTTQMEMSVPKVDLEIPDIALIRRSPQKGEEKTKKDKDIKRKSDPTFKLPKIGFGDIASEETIPKMNVNVEEGKARIEKFTTEGTDVKEDPYNLLSKSSLSRTKLPKREDIEIPGMEDMSKRTTAKGIKEPKTVFTGHYEDIQAETVQLSIDVDSVKEAVSKLPGFKLPKVDTSGMPIPEEITVIDANAQRISVKTPTKTKHEEHYSKFDVTASPDIFKTTVKLPKITAADLASEELLTVIDIKKREQIIIPGKESPQEVTTLHTQETQGREGIESEYKSAATFRSDGKRAKIAMPSIGIAKPDIRIPDVGIYLPKQNLSEQKGDNIKGERTIFLEEEMPKYETKNQIGGVINIPEIDGIEYIDSGDGSPAKKDGGIRRAGVNLDAAWPEADISFPDIGGEVRDVEAEEHTFKLPTFGAVIPNISVNVSDAKKDINIDGVEIKTPEKEGKGGRFKMPSLGISMPKVKGPKIDLSLPKKDVDDTLPEADIPEVEIEKPELEIKPGQVEGELDGKGIKFRKPKFGIKIPKLKGPQFDSSLSKKDVGVTLPEAKAEVKLPEAPEIEVTLRTIDGSMPEQKMEVDRLELEIKPPRIEGELDMQGGKFKMPEFGVKLPKIKQPEFDLSSKKNDTDVKLPQAKAEFNIEHKEPAFEIEGPEIAVRKQDAEMPHLGFSLPKVKGPQFNLSSSKKDVDVTLPETSFEGKLHKAPKIDASLGKAEVLIPEMEAKKPEVKIKPLQTDVNLEAQGGKFQMPKFGITMPKVKGPEFHLGLSKKDGDVILPEAKVEVGVPDAPKVDVNLGKADVSLPEGNIELKMKPLESEVEIDGQGSKFKMPKLGMSMPKVKGPEIHFGLSKKDGDVTLPEAKVEVKVPDSDIKELPAEVEIKGPEMQVEAKGSPLKFKMPTFKLPKFGVGTPNVSVEEPDMDKDVKIIGADINIPDKGSVIDIEGPSLDMKTTGAEQDGKGSKFKMPHLGFSKPKIKGPKIDLSLSKKDAEVKLPETKADVKLPEVDLGKVDVSIPEVKVEVKKPEMEMQLLQTEDDLDGRGEKFKFGIKLPKVKGPEFDLSLSKKDADVTVGKAEVSIPESELEIKPLKTDIELEGHKGKFQMPKFGITMPKLKGPEIDLSLSKKDADVTLPAADSQFEFPEAPEIAVDMKADVNLPDVDIKESSAKVEVKSPEIEAQLSNVKGSPLKFKLPTFKFPKFGATTPNVSTEVPDIDNEIKIDGADMHISVPHTDIDVPEVKAEVHLPEVQVKKPSGSVVIEPGVEVDGKSKKRFSLPRFSFSKTSGKAPEIDASLQDVNVSEGNVEVKGGKADIKVSECEAEVEGSKFKMPKFGFTLPNVTGPEIDFSLSKKDVHVTLPQAEAELPAVKIKQPSATVEIKAPEIEAPTVNIEGSPSKLKMPTFTLPKFEAATPKVSVEVPDVDKDIKLDGATVDVTAPSIDTKGISVDVKAKGSELEGSGTKFKMPKFGISMPKVKGPEFDWSLSKKDGDVTLPEAKAEVHLPDVKIKHSSATGELELEAQTGNVEGSPSNFKMPTFTLPKFGATTPKVSIEMGDLDKDINIDGATVDVTAPSIDTEGLSIDVKAKGGELEGSGSKFKMPKFDISMPKMKGPEIDLSLTKKDGEVILPEAKVEITRPNAEIKEPEVEIKPLEIKVATKDKEGSPSKFKMPTFKFPKFGVGTDKDIKIDGADIKIPEEVMEIHIEAPSIDIEGPSTDIKTTGIEHEGKGSKFRLPGLSFSGPQIKKPDIDLSLSKKDVDVNLPEIKAEVKLPDVGLKEPSAEVEVKAPEIKISTKGKEGSPSKFKMPTFKLPKFGSGTPSATIEMPDVDGDIKIDGVDIKVPEEVLAVDIAAPSIDIEGPSIDIKTTGIEHEGKGSKFKMPSLSFSGPQIKRPDIDLSLSKKDVDVNLPEVKAEVKLPDVGLKEPSAEVEVKAPEIKISTKGKEGSPSKFKMPTFKLPKFGIGTPSATIEMPDVDGDIKIDGVDSKVPEEVLAVDIAAPSIDIKGPSIDIKTTGIEHEGKGSKFKLPSLGFSGPQIKRPDIDLSLSKKDVDVNLPEVKAEVKLPDVGLKEPSAEVEVKAPEIKISTKGKEGSPSKYKMPTFKLPKFGIGTPSATIVMPDVDGDIKIDGVESKVPEEVLAVDIAAPSMDIKGPSIDIKTTGIEREGKGSKFKLPSLGFSGPQIKRPDIDLSLSKKDVDVNLPEVKAEVKLPDVGLKEPSAAVEVKAPEIKISTKGKEGSPSKYKMPTFKLPKFGIGTPSATIEMPDVDGHIKIDGVDSKVPEEVLAVDIAAPSIDIKGPSIDIKTTGIEHEGKGSKFKLPSLGFSGPQIKRPDIDLSLSKKDVDVNLPEVKAEVKLPDVGLKEPSAEVEVKAPEIKISTKGKEGSPSKYKMPTFKLPKFGIGTPSATIEMPDVDGHIKIDGVDSKVPEEVLAVDIAAPSIDIEGPSIDIKTTGIEHEGKGSKFKLPSLSFSGPQIKRPDIDLSLSKKDVDVNLPEVKAEVKLPDVGLKEPSAEVEVKAPEIKISTKGKEGSPSKYKMPTFKLPKFGIGTPSATIEMPDVDGHIKIDGVDSKVPEEVLAVDIAAPSIDIEGPSIDIKTTGIEHEGKGSKFKLPSLSFSGPQIKRPDIDLSLSKKDVDVNLPEVKAEVKLPDVGLKEPSAEVEVKAPEIKISTKGKEGSPSKYKMPTFKLPKFGIGTPSATIEMPDVDGHIKIDGVDSKVPEEVLAVDIAAPSIDIEGPSIDIKTTGIEHEGKGSKFKLPSLGFSGPQIKRPDIDLSLSKKDVDVNLPEVKAEVKLPDVGLKEPSAEVEVKAPEIKISTKVKEGSPSKYKMPTFKLPKFGVSIPSATIEVPNKDVKIDGADIKVPEEVLAVDIAAPSIDIEGPSIDIKTTGTELEGKGSKFKLPSLGFSGPQIKLPDIDLSLSKKDVDVKITEPKAEVKLPDVELKESAKVEIKAPGIDVQTSNIEGSSSKVKMPTFKLPKFGAATSQISVEVPDVDKDIKVDGAGLKLPEAKAEVIHPDVEIKEYVGSISVSQEPIIEGDVKLKKASWTMPKFSFSKTSVKSPEIEVNPDVPNVDVALPEAKTDMHLPDIDVKEPSGISIEGAPATDIDAKLKKPRFSLPKFSFSKQTSKESNVDVRLTEIDVDLPKVNVEVKQPEVELKSPECDVELEGQENKFKMPTFGISMPKVKGPEFDLSLSKKDVDVTLPEAKAEVQLPDVKIKQPSTTVEMNAPEIEGNLEGLPSKLKMPTFTLPKFGAATPKVSVEVPDVDKDIKIEGVTVDVTAPSIDTEGLSGDVKAKGGELEVSGSKLKMPKFGISMPKVKGPEIDLSLSKDDVDVTLPEAKAEVELPNVEAISAPDAPTVEVETKFKRPNWAFPKFSFSKTSGKAPDVDVNLETPRVDATSTEAKADVQGPSGAISMEEPPATELEANLKKTKFSIPRFSFSKSGAKESEVSAEHLRVDVSLPEGEVIVKQPEVKIKAPELEAEQGQGSKFRLPKFGIALPKVKGPEEDSNASQGDVSITLPEVKGEVKLPEIAVKESPASVEIEVSETESKSKDIGGSPLKFKMPTLKMPKFGAATNVTIEAPETDKTAEIDGVKLTDAAINIKDQSVDIKMDMSKATITDSENSTTDGFILGSPSKFKLPLFKMPMLGLSRANAEDGNVPVDTECKEDQMEMKVEPKGETKSPKGETKSPKGETKSPKVSLTSFGELLKNFDVEFDVPKKPENLETTKEVHERDDEKKVEEKEKETKQDTIKSPERTGWFKFPRFGLSSPSEPAKISEGDEKSPVWETADEDISPTCSVQSSDAFADISSAMTSEHLGLSLSSPTKVTVKYSDPDAATGLGEMHTNIITSTTRTELISVEPNLPEKITILSSGVSSSSEDTLRLNSGKIHVITSNIQATPESQHAKLLTAVQIQAAGGLPQESGSNEAASWTVEESQSGKRTVFERHLVRETSSERSESKETIVITKQITRVLDSSEPISGETASSIQRLRDSVHSEKMRFFDGADE